MCNTQKFFVTILFLPLRASFISPYHFLKNIIQFNHHYSAYSQRCSIWNVSVESQANVTKNGGTEEANLGTQDV